MLKKIIKWLYKKSLIIFAFVCLLFGIVSCGNTSTSLNEYESKSAEVNVETKEAFYKDTQNIDENGLYTSKDEVALYIFTYKKLPKNYITKNAAKKLGWDSSKNNLWDVAPGKSIGGDIFGNYEKLLPSIKGRTYYECDIDYNGKKRNAKRIVYADDFDEDIGYIYYTSDHYKTFERLY